MAKETSKTKNVSIRFDIEKIEFLMTKRNCTSFQKCVDYLLDKFFWEMGGDVLAVNPTEKITGQWIHKEQLPKPISSGAEYVQQKLNKIEPIILSLYESYKQEFNNARSADDIAVTIREMKKEKDLTPKDKLELDNYATNVFNEKGFYHD
jgi:hypothetical protein